MRIPEPVFAAGDHLAIDLPGSRALFTTRRGGFSNGPYESLNLGRLTDDDADHVERNRASVATLAGATLVYGRQVHGTFVARLDDEGEPPESSEPSEPSEADGQATARRGRAPMVLTADCLPIAIGGEGAVAVVHAGWRGLAAGVITEGVRAVRELGASGPLSAAIGPGAGPCCYEVGDEVRAEFESHGTGVRRGRNLDLKAIARAELRSAGVDTIHDAGMCTICSDSTFFSHRRDRGVTGRQAGLAWLT
jgi:hypothetical protein